MSRRRVHGRDCVGWYVCMEECVLHLRTHTHKQRQGAQTPSTLAYKKWAIIKANKQMRAREKASECAARADIPQHEINPCMYAIQLRTRAPQQCTFRGGTRVQAYMSISCIDVWHHTATYLYINACVYPHGSSKTLRACFKVIPFAVHSVRVLFVCVCFVRIQLQIASISGALCRTRVFWLTLSAHGRQKLVKVFFLHTHVQHRGFSTCVKIKRNKKLVRYVPIA